MATTHCFLLRRLCFESRLCLVTALCSTRLRLYAANVRNQIGHRCLAANPNRLELHRQSGQSVAVESTSIASVRLHPPTIATIRRRRRQPARAGSVRIRAAPRLSSACPVQFCRGRVPQPGSAGASTGRCASATADARRAALYAAWGPWARAGGVGVGARAAVGSSAVTRSHGTASRRRRRHGHVCI